MGQADLTGSCQHQTFAFGFRYRIAKLTRGVDPERHCLVDIPERSFLRIAVRHAPGKLRHLGDERVVSIAPVNDNRNY